jgi:hypothetical protein
MIIETTSTNHPRPAEIEQVNFLKEKKAAFVNL